MLSIDVTDNLSSQRFLFIIVTVMSKQCKQTVSNVTIMRAKETRTHTHSKESFACQLFNSFHTNEKHVVFDLKFNSLT